jgi:hypothetical protein
LQKSSLAIILFVDPSLYVTLYIGIFYPIAIGKIKTAPCPPRPEYASDVPDDFALKALPPPPPKEA